MLQSCEPLQPRAQSEMKNAMFVRKKKEKSVCSLAVPRGIPALSKLAVTSQSLRLKDRMNVDSCFVETFVSRSHLDVPPMPIFSGKYATQRFTTPAGSALSFADVLFAYEQKTITFPPPPPPPHLQSSFRSLASFQAVLNAPISRRHLHPLWCDSDRSFLSEWHLKASRTPSEFI